MKVNKKIYCDNTFFTQLLDKNMKYTIQTISGCYTDYGTYTCDSEKKPIIGFIGQGWIGKNYADHFEDRGFEVIRYDIDKYKNNLRKLEDAEIVFIAVPTPTKKEKFDTSILEDAISKTYPGQTIVIKSTIQIGVTNKLQDKYQDRYIIHSPEFLTEATAREDVDNPERVVVGFSDLEGCLDKSKEVLKIMPNTGEKFLCPNKEAEIVKYASNVILAHKVLLFNLLYDLSKANDIHYDTVKEIVGYDSRIGTSHSKILHKNGRGAGGHCFIKDLAAFREMYSKTVKKDSAIKYLLNAEMYNKELLEKSNKDLDILSEVY